MADLAALEAQIVPIETLRANIGRAILAPARQSHRNLSQRRQATS